MHFEWTGELETGCPNIDGQHKQLIASLEEFQSACKRGVQDFELKKILDFLVNYTIKHFADEEAFQVRHNYPDYERHKLLHDNFKIVASELAERLMREGASADMVVEIHFTIGKWLVCHIKDEDRKIALHARA